MVSDMMVLDDVPPLGMDASVSYWIEAVRKVLRQEGHETAFENISAHETGGYIAERRPRIAGILLRLLPHAEGDTPRVVVVKHGQIVTLSRCVGDSLEIYCPTD